MSSQAAESPGRRSRATHSRSSAASAARASSPACSSRLRNIRRRRAPLGYQHHRSGLRLDPQCWPSAWPRCPTRHMLAASKVCCHLRVKVRKGVLLALTVTAVSGTALFVTSAVVSAGDPPGDPHANLPVTSLPRTPLLSGLSTALSRAPDAASFGITSATFNEARVLARTSVGPLYYLAPGQGNCLVLDSALACGKQITSPEPLTLFSGSPSGLLVGGGIVAPEIRSVTVTLPSGKGAVLKVDPYGIFRLTEKAGLEVSFGVHVTPNR